MGKFGVYYCKCLSEYVSLSNKYFTDKLFENARERCRIEQNENVLNKFYCDYFPMMHCSFFYCILNLDYSVIIER